MKKENIHTGLSAIAITFSITAICTAYTNAKPLSWDIAGTLVGILSMLATILIGWQIYNVITIDKKMRDIMNGRLADLAVCTKNAIKLAQIELQTSMMDGYLGDGNFKMLLRSAIKNIDRLIEIKDSTNSQKFVNILIQMYNIKNIRNNIDAKETKQLAEKVKKLLPFTPNAYDLLKMIDS